MCLMEKLTFQEEEIMLIIWQVKEGVIKDFLNCMEEPRPTKEPIMTQLPPAAKAFTTSPE